MSKKCCGIIYKDEKFCTMCGKPLVDLPDIEEQEDTKVDTPEILDMAEVDKIAASVMGDGTETDEEEAKNSDSELSDKVEKTAETAESSESIDAEEATESTDAPVELKDEKEEEADDEDEEEDDETASVGQKFFGTLMILLMLAAIAAVGLGVYFIWLNPFYRNHDINNPVVYEQMATDTDVTNIQTKPVLSEVSIEIATPVDASSEDMATEGDASTTDTEVEEDADVSQDEE